MKYAKRNNIKPKYIIISALILFILLVFFLIILSTKKPVKDIVWTCDDLPFKPLNLAVVVELDGKTRVFEKENYPENKRDRLEHSVKNDTDDMGIVTYNGPGKIGIDVSYYQKEIDWVKVKQSGVDFAMIRLGYRGAVTGKLVIDEKFVSNIENAIANDIDVGVYFFSQAISAEEALEEAQFVLDAIKPYKDEIEFPIAFDWEWVHFEDNRTETVSGDVVSLAAKAFCEKIEENGLSSIIYMNKNMGYNFLDLETINNHNIWIAEYEEMPTFFYDFKMWQYTETGKIDGINGNVDINIAYFE